MDDLFEKIKNTLTGGCSEMEFKDLRCPVCGSELNLVVHPHGHKFFVRCQKDSTHLAMHGEATTTPDWWCKNIGAGWY
jgi:hypothetical protein